GQVLVERGPLVADTAPVEVWPDRPVTWDGLSGRPTTLTPGAAAVPVRLTPGKQPSAKLKEVAGILTVRVSATRPLFAVEDVLKAEGKTVRDASGRTLQVLQASRSGDSFEVRVQVQPQGTGGAGPLQVVKGRRGVVWMRGSAQESLGEATLL